MTENGGSGQRAVVSLWDGTSAEPETDRAPLPDDDIVLDVAIVGGGFTGLSTALYAAEAGLSAQVLEAEHLGYGGSGRNAGLVNAGVWHPPAQVREKLGERYGQRFLRLFADGPATVFDLIERHQMRCEPTREGTIHAAHAPAGMADLKARHREWQRMGEPVDLLSRREVAEATGTQAFYGGLHDHRAGTINPMGYTRGLARAARAAGARISTGVRVTALKPEAGGWRVETSEGALRAKAVVLGTNAYTDELWPGLSRVFTPIHYFQLATEPLGDRAAGIMPGRQGLWTTAPVMTSLRKDVEGRIIIGSMGTVIGTKAAGLSERWARKTLARLFPALGPVRFDEAWHGRIAMTPDHLPRICILADGLYTAIGYNGRGITTGTIFGKAMAGLLSGAAQDTLPLPVSTAEAVPSAPWMARVYQAAFTASQIWRSL
ncbi:MAG: FAD-binding oxidoreductase [Pseudomonadota bacterium]